MAKFTYVTSDERIMLIKSEALKQGVDARDILDVSFLAYSLITEGDIDDMSIATLRKEILRTLDSCKGVD